MNNTNLEWNNKSRSWNVEEQSVSLEHVNLFQSSFLWSYFEIREVKLLVEGNQSFLFVSNPFWEEKSLFGSSIFSAPNVDCYMKIYSILSSVGRWFGYWIFRTADTGIQSFLWRTKKSHWVLRISSFSVGLKFHSNYE